MKRRRAVRGATFLGLLLTTSGLALSPLPQLGAVAAQTALTTEYGLRSKNGKPGLFVERVDRSHYRVSAFVRSMKGDSDQRLTELANMVMMRAAQFALENGRDYFTIIGDLDTDTTGGKMESYRGTPDRLGPEQCGRDASGRTFCLPRETIKGSPSSSAYNPGYFGRTGIVQFWTGAEGQQLLREREGQPIKGQPIPAEGFYKMFRDKTPGKWPELSEIYGERSKRMRGG